MHRDILAEASGFLCSVLGPVAMAAAAAAGRHGGGGAGGGGGARTAAAALADAPPVPVPHRTTGGALGLGLSGVMLQLQQHNQQQQQPPQAHHPSGTASNGHAAPGSAAAAAAAAGPAPSLALALSLLRHAGLTTLLLSAGGIGEALYRRLMLLALRDLPPHALTSRDRSVAEPLWLLHALFRPPGPSDPPAPLHQQQPPPSAAQWLHALLTDPALGLIRAGLVAPARLTVLVTAVCAPDTGRSTFSDALRDLAEALRGRDAEGEDGGGGGGRGGTPSDEEDE